MKLNFVVLTVALSLGVCVFNNPVLADEKGSHKGSMIDEEITAEVTESGAIKVGNTICPLSNEKVGEMGDIVEYEHEGKIYNLCCKACLKDFKKDPDKYIEIINQDLKENTPESADSEQ